MEQRFDEGPDIAQIARQALIGRGRLLLAVSGGLDSMVLLDAAARVVNRGDLRVATYDHATGPHAARAVKLVLRRCRDLGIMCVSGRAAKAGTRESEWRAARWTFLRGEAERSGSTIVTAHTLDDQIETVFIRVLRGAGARGLAGLYAESDIVRPFLALARDCIARHAARFAVTWVDDPSNFSRLHLRNRIRHDLLPAIVRLRPDFPAQLIDISLDAARWRRSMVSLADTVTTAAGSDGSLRIARAALAGYDAEGLRALWPSLAARSNVVLDRRGTHRLAEFTMNGQTGGSIQLSGGIEVRMFRDHLLLRRWDTGGVQRARNARLLRLGMQLPAALESLR